MQLPDGLHYTTEHEWLRLEGAEAVIGITDFAQDALGDVVFVQLPEPGTKVVAGDSFAEVGSTKSVSDIYAPVSGTVVETNPDLADSPQRLNEDPYGEGWLCVIAPDDIESESALLDAEGYRKLIES